MSLSEEDRRAPTPLAAFTGALVLPALAFEGVSRSDVDVKDGATFSSEVVDTFIIEKECERSPPDIEWPPGVVEEGAFPIIASTGRDCQNSLINPHNSEIREIEEDETLMKVSLSALVLAVSPDPLASVLNDETSTGADF